MSFVGSCNGEKCEWWEGNFDLLATSLLVASFALLLFCGIPTLQRFFMNEKKSVLLRRQMTPIGRFALLSQTERNPSILSFFIALGNEKGVDPISMDEFKDLWKSRVMNKHERFRCRVSKDGNKYFEVVNHSFDEYAKKIPHPKDEREFKKRLNSFLTSQMDIHDKLWEAEICTGGVGKSGTVLECQQNYDSETVALFRSHHCLCDGVSMSTVIADAADEANELNEMVLKALEKLRNDAEKGGLLLQLGTLILGIIFYYIVGTIRALSAQLWNMATSSNPFDELMNNDERCKTRSLAWKKLANVDEAKALVKRIDTRATLNDLFVTLLSAAVEKQYEEFKPNSYPSSVNFVIPVHLSGGLTLPGESIGNKIGAFVAPIPFSQFSNSKTRKRLTQISQIMRNAKKVPAPQISWVITALISKFVSGEEFAKKAIVQSNCHAVAVISNVKGFPFKIHWNGRRIETICPFLPLPPGIPIGVVVSTYDQMILLSIDADSRIVPDADNFLKFMMDEYEEMKNNWVKN